MSNSEDEGDELFEPGEDATIGSGSSGKRKMNHSSRGKQTVPAFLNKLYTMVNNDDNTHLIRWSDSGDSFLVIAPDQFSKALLPRFFKHQNFGSFVRQLNMYGFNKVSNISQGVLKGDQSDNSDTLEFKNEHFIKDQPGEMCMIHRKKGATKESKDQTVAVKAGPNALITGQPSSATSDDSNAIAIDLRTILTEIATIRKQQTTIASDLKDLTGSNKQLWTEAIASRERHQRHQDTINKIVRFLGSVFGGKVLEEADKGKSQPVSTPLSASIPTQRRQETAKRPTKKRRLLLKANEADPGSPFPSSGAQIQEIEVPIDELDDLPIISSSPTHVNSLAAHLDPSLLLDEIAGLSSVPATADPSPSSSRAVLPPNYFDPNQNGGLHFPLNLPLSLPSPPIDNTAHVQDESQQLTKAKRDFEAISAQMDSLQAALDKLVKNLPADQIPPQAMTALQNVNGANSSSSGPDDFNLDAFLAQFANDNANLAGPSYSNGLTPYVLPGPSSMGAQAPITNAWRNATSWPAQNDALPPLFNYEGLPVTEDEQRFSWEQASSSATSNQATPVLNDLPTFETTLPESSIQAPESRDDTPVVVEPVNKGKKRASDSAGRGASKKSKLR